MQSFAEEFWDKIINITWASLIEVSVLASELTALWGFTLWASPKIVTLHISWVSFCLHAKFLMWLHWKKGLDTSLGILLSVIVGANCIISTSSKSTQKSASWLWSVDNVIYFSEQSDWWDSMPICFLIRPQFYQRRCPDPIFWRGRKVHVKNLVWGQD